MTDDDPSAPRRSEAPPGVAPAPARSQDDIERWVTSYVARLLECDESQVDTGAPFSRLGLDSSAAVGMTGDLEAWLGLELEPTLPYDHPTIQALSRHLSQELAARGAA